MTDSTFFPQFFHGPVHVTVTSPTASRGKLSINRVTLNRGGDKKQPEKRSPKGWSVLKLTYPLKIDPWKRRFLLETIIFRGYVSFGARGLSWNLKCFFCNLRSLWIQGSAAKKMHLGCNFGGWSIFLGGTWIHRGWSFCSISLGIFPFFSYSGDGIVTLNPILGRGLDS